VSAPTAAEVTELLGRWWLKYDEGDIDGLAPMLTEDATWRTRTDTGATDYEEFVRSDLSGRDRIVAWQKPHRAESPHPLRHMTVNVVVDPDGAFASYLFVTQILGGKPDPISTGVLRGRVGRGPDGLQFSAFELTLDTQESVPLEQR
jgi:hypothetical protein